MTKTAAAFMAVFGCGAIVHATKNDTCPSPWPALDIIQDKTITGARFSYMWPKQLDGVWYTVAAADRFQPSSFTCGRYNYTVKSMRTAATYLVKNTTDGQWQEFQLKGFALARPGDYYETSLAALPAGKDPYDPKDAWRETVAHFGDETDPSNTIWVRWGCTKDPLGAFQFTEILSRKVPLAWEAIEKALAHLKSIDAQNIDNVIKMVHKECNYPWQPEDISSGGVIV